MLNAIRLLALTALQRRPAFPARLPGWAVVAAVVVALVAGLVFGVLPARRATELDPVAALGRG